MGSIFPRWLPRSTELRAAERRALVGCLALLLLLLAVTGANATLGLGGQSAVKPIRDWLSCVIYILVAIIVALRALRASTKRVPWAIFAAGLTLYGAGNILWSLWFEHLRVAPIPSLCDGLWLALYPLSYVGIVGLARLGGQRTVPAGVWLDGIIAGAGLAAIGAALVVRPVLASATGGSVAVATELAYPVGDLLLAALVVGVVALRGWRLDRLWSFLAGGFLLLAVADCMYAVQVAGGSSSPSAMTNFLYVLATAALALAAWQEESVRHESQLTGRSVLLIPAGFMLVALGLLLYDHWHRLDPVALGLAVLTLLAAVVRVGLTFRNIRELAEARQQAATDDLTSLPNRRLIMHRIETAIAAAERNGSALSVLLLDLDNFKELNDTLGHDAGDALLRLIGPRIRAVLRPTDTVARLGGDEFALLLQPEPDRQRVAQVAAKILGSLREPFQIQGISLRLTASLGIASYPAHAQDAGGLLRGADIAMYQAKTARTGYEFYASARDTSSRDRLALAAELAVALEPGGGIEVHYQPKADTVSRRIVGVEALVRWRHADGRLIAPIEFVGTAEQAGLSRVLTRRVLALALDQLRVWRAGGHDLHVAVNTTVADLLDMSFPDQVATALDVCGLPPEALILEVTESSVLSDPSRIGNVLGRLAELGIGVSLDDFGTGYSSLTHLKSLTVTEVKIDRSFVAGMCVDTTDEAIVFSTIQLAGKLGIRVVAEGVEDEQTWDALSALGCELIQGYVVGPPVAAAELEPHLNRRSGPAQPGLVPRSLPAGLPV